MLEALVGQFLQSGAGADVLSQLKGHGVEGADAHAAVTATAEGAMQQVSGADSGLGGLGGLAGLAGGLLGGGAAAGGGVAAMAAPVASFVAEKTGLSPAIATAVVQVALPKLLELIQGGGAAGASPAAGGLAGMLGGLLK